MEDAVANEIKIGVLKAIEPLINALYYKNVKKFYDFLKIKGMTFKDWQEQIGCIFDEVGGIDKFNNDLLTTRFADSLEEKVDIFKFNDVEIYGIEYNLSYQNQATEWTLVARIKPIANSEFIVELADLHIL